MLWIGVIGFVAATAYFIQLGTQTPPGKRIFHVITAIITGVAAFSYLMMATGAGAMVVDGGRIFYYFRYIDWVITTPLLLLDLALLALAQSRRNVGFIAGLVGLDLFMILTGLLAGSRTSGFGRGFWFLVSTVALVALLYLLVTRLFVEAAGQPEVVHQIFRTLAYLTVVLWAFYPIVWLLGTEGFGAVNSTVEILLFLILDFLAKIGFGFLLLTNREALDQVGGDAQPSRRRVV